VDEEGGVAWAVGGAGEWRGGVGMCGPGWAPGGPCGLVVRVWRGRDGWRSDWAGELVRVQGRGATPSGAASQEPKGLARGRNVVPAPWRARAS
jgi:hypothetical protein